MRRHACLLLLFVLFAFPCESPRAEDEQEDQGYGWTLVDAHQSACFDGNGSTGSFELRIRGIWTDALRIGIVDLPAGARVSVSDREIAPGGSSGQIALASVEVELPADTLPGKYTAFLWAHEKGEPRKTVPVTIRVQRACRR